MEGEGRVSAATRSNTRSCPFLKSGRSSPRPGLAIGLIAEDPRSHWYALGIRTAAPVPDSEYYSSPRTRSSSVSLLRATVYPAPSTSTSAGRIRAL